MDYPENRMVAIRNKNKKTACCGIHCTVSWDTICEPCLLDAIAWTNKFLYEADDDRFDSASQQDDEASKKWMAVQHHFFSKEIREFQKTRPSKPRYDDATHHVTQTQQTFHPASYGPAMSGRGRRHPRDARADFPTASCIRMREEACPRSGPAVPRWREPRGAKTW